MKTGRLPRLHGTSGFTRGDFSKATSNPGSVSSASMAKAIGADALADLLLAIKERRGHLS